MDRGKDKRLADRRSNIRSEVIRKSFYKINKQIVSKPTIEKSIKYKVLVRIKKDIFAVNGIQQTNRGNA